METKHTPGEWEIVEHNWSDTSIMAGDKVICTQSIYDEATEENQEDLERETAANSRLIAAAPEMLDMLERAKSAMGVIRRSISAHPDCTEGSEFDDMTTTAQEMGDEIEALIKKAKLHETRKHNK